MTTDSEKLLKGLAGIQHPKTDGLVKQEFEILSKRLSETNHYDEINDLLDQLNEISHRVTDEAVPLLTDLISTLPSKDIEYPEIFSEFYSVETLQVRCLELLDRIRYFDVPQILKFLLEPCSSTDERVVKKSNEVLGHICEYNIHLFYGTDSSHAYGPMAQSHVMSVIENLEDEALLDRASTIIDISHLLLSPIATGTTSTFENVTWETASVESGQGIKDVRNRCLSLLERLFGLPTTENQKVAIISAMYRASNFPHREEYSDEFKQMIYSNLARVLNFYSSVIDRAPLPVLEKIEDRAYWCYKNHDNQETQDQARWIGNQLADSEEYLIFKTLIGYEGKFVNWDEEDTSTESVLKEREAREAKLVGYVDQISDENFSEWESRILDYAETDSDDLATFMYFRKFLEGFSAKHPNLAISFLKSNVQNLSQFIVSILVGIESSKPEATRQIVDDLIKRNLFLTQIAGYIQYLHNFDLPLVELVYERATEVNERDALVYLVGSVVSHRDESKVECDALAIKIIEELTRDRDARWVNVCWYKDKFEQMMSEINAEQISIVLDNLIHLPIFDHHAEAVLDPAVPLHCGKILQFFGDRLTYETNEPEYEQLPFDFYSLHETLSQFPELCMTTIRSWYDGNDGIKTDYGARLIEKIFPDFPTELEEIASRMVIHGDITDREFVLKVLQNYKGSDRIHNLCKQLIAALPDETHYSAMYAILTTTGIVEGEYGLAEEYQHRREQLTPWLEDDDEKVRSFAESFLSDLDKLIEDERKRVKEDIEIRKHQFRE